MKNTKFKVGDRVRTVKPLKNEIRTGAIEHFYYAHYIYYVNFGSKFNGHNGAANGDSFKSNHENGWWVDESELINDKETKVLEILRSYDKIRSSKGQGTTQVDS